MNKNRISTLLKLIQVLFFVDGAVWLIFGVLGLIRGITTASDLRLILSVLMFFNAAVLFWFGVKITGTRAQVFFLAILYMALNVVLSITDQFGAIDALILLLNLSVLGLLIITRQRIKQAEN